MRRLGQVFDELCSYGNLVLAFAGVQRGRRYREDIRAFQGSLTEELGRLRTELLSGTFAFGAYRQFRVYDPKERLISAAPVRERVVHHAIIQVCGERLERSLIDDTYACRKGKGQFQALARAEHFARHHEWSLKLDMRHYFDSIDHEVMLSALRRRLKDARLLRLLEQLVRSYETTAGRGMPIGNLTSQYFANLYLDPVDRLATSAGGRGYVRYMDDILVFGAHEELRGLLREVGELARNRLRLELKGGGSLQPVARGVDFLGFRVRPGSVTLARDSRRRVRRRVGWLQEALATGRLTEYDYQSRLQAVFAHLAHGDTWRFRNGLVSRMDLP